MDVNRYVHLRKSSTKGYGVYSPSVSMDVNVPGRMSGGVGATLYAPDHFIVAEIPSPPQGVWMVGGVPLRGYALSILVGIVVAIVWSQRRYADRGGRREVVVDVALAAVPAGIIGGRVYHLATDWRSYWGPAGTPGDWWKITNGGLGIWGAVVGGGLATWLVLRWKRLELAPFADSVAPPILVAQGIGRLGNWFNQELYGRPTDLPWGLKIFERVDAHGACAPVTGHSTGNVIAVVQPTFLYEMLWNFAIAAVIVWIDRAFQLGGGRVFALYVAGYTVGRFWIELLRADQATHVCGLRINTLTSTICFVSAVLFLVWARSRHRKELKEFRA